MFKAEVLYCYYELKSMNRANYVVLMLFFALYFYCVIEGKPLSQYTSAECYLVIQIVSVYIVLRMILTGLSLPNNVYETERNRVHCLKNNGMGNVNLPNIFMVRVGIKVFYTYIINIVTIYLIMSALNLIVDVRNYVLIASLIFIGTLYTLGIGFFINIVMQALNLKKELMLVFQIIFFLLYFWIDSDSYLFPITIVMTQISGVISNDIIYSQYTLKEIGSYWLLWVIMVVLSIVIVYVSTQITSLVLLRDTYRRKDEK